MVMENIKTPTTSLNQPLVESCFVNIATEVSELFEIILSGLKKLLLC